MPLEDFNADLEALGLPKEDLAGLGSSPGQSNPQGGVADPNAAGQPIKAGGREYKSQAEFIKSHEALLKDYTKKSQAAARVKELDEFQSYLQQHPKLRDGLQQKIDEYHRSLNAGNSEAQARRDAGLPPEVVQRFEAQTARLQAQFDDMALEREISDIRSRYNLDEPTLQKVLKESMDNDGISLEKAFKIVSADDAMAARRMDEQKQKAMSQRQKLDAATGPATGAQITPSQKSPGKMNDAEFKAAAAARLESFGVSSE